MVAKFNPSSLEISDFDYEEIVSRCDKLRELSKQFKLRLVESAAEIYRNTERDLLHDLDYLASQGMNPVAAVMYRSLLEGISDESLELLAELDKHIYLNRTYGRTAFEKQLQFVTVFPFMMYRSHRIPVAHWRQLAEAGRELVLAFLETGSESSARYISAKEIFDPLYDSERMRLMKHPEYGLSIYDQQFF